MESLEELRAKVAQKEASLSANAVSADGTARSQINTLIEKYKLMAEPGYEFIHGENGDRWRIKRQHELLEELESGNESSMDSYHKREYFPELDSWIPVLKKDSGLLEDLVEFSDKAYNAASADERAYESKMAKIFVPIILIVFIGSIILGFKLHSFITGLVGVIIAAALFIIYAVKFG